MSHPIGKVSLGVLGAFLKQHSEEWDVEGLQSFEELLPPHRPVTVDELVLALSLENQGDDHTYLFSMEMTPEEAIEQTDLKNIPSVSEEDLPEYIIRMGKSRDFLYVAPSFEDLANGFYVNLMPAGDEDDDGEDISEDEPPSDQ